MDPVLARDEGDVRLGRPPQEGENALAVYRAASERLYARKVMRGYVRGQQPQRPRAVS